MENDSQYEEAMIFQFKADARGRSVILGANRVTKHLLDENDVLRLLHEVVDRAGSQSAWARRSGVDRTQLNGVLRGKRRLSPTIIQALKLKKVVAYERKQ
jgi:hypothetical protein